MSSPERFPRVLITCELETRTPLHIGDGGTTTRQDLTRDEGQGQVPVEISSVATDKDGHAYLPGRTLKGNLRSWLGHTKAPGDTVKHLFGQEGTPRTDESKSGPNEFLGGRAQILDAFVVSPPAACAVPYWDKDRLTGVTASTAIQRTTKTVRPKKLFHEEFVPAGIKFQVRITADDATLEEIQLLLFALHGFEHPDFPVRLGAGRKNGRGVMRVVPGSIRVKAVSPESLDAWLESEQSTWFAALVELPNAPTLIDASRELYEVQAPPRLTVDLELTFDGPFLVNDPSRTKKDGEHDPGMPDHAFLRDQHGRVLLPADSLRGALRSQAERILRTLGLHACHVDDPRDACPPVTEIDGVKTIWEKPASGADHEAGLCPACRLFGAAGWGSALEVSDFVPPPPVGGLPLAPIRVLRQEFVAIDRFLGGAAAGKKFNAEAALRPTLMGRLVLQLDRTEAWAPALLALAVRDLLEGDVPLGFGAAKGYGACHGRIVSSSDALLQPASQAPHEGIVALAQRYRALDAANSAAVARRWFGALSTAATGGAASVEGIAAAGSAMDSGVAPAGPAWPGRAQLPQGEEFHIPYHFVPVKPQDSSGELTTNSFAQGRVGHVTHDRYARTSAGSTFSGRVLCRLTTRSPVVVGASRTPNPDGSHTVLPFLLDGCPAIPGSTVRGMVSAIAEAASNSACRVLSNHELRYRAGRGPKRRAGTTYEFFQAISKDLLPLSADRSFVTIAERLFGFVEENATSGQPNAGMALASRLRFSFGLFRPGEEVGAFLPPTLLRILSAPKVPPPPAFYFRTAGHQQPRYVSKAEVAPESHWPQGRKFYVHGWDGRGEPWATKYPTEDLKEKSWVTPLRSGLTFYFHIDFFNLNRRELALLCFALRPFESFWHKLGLGKAIGLGSVSLDPLGVFYVDRTRRYEWDGGQPLPPRYASVRFGRNVTPVAIPAWYAAERGTLMVDAAGSGSWPEPESLRNEYAGVADADILRALEVIGDPRMVVLPVHYPLCIGQDPEREGYEWFAATQQHLEPLSKASAGLPILRKVARRRRH